MIPTFSIGRTLSPPDTLTLTNLLSYCALPISISVLFHGLYLFLFKPVCLSVFVSVSLLCPSFSFSSLSLFLLSLAFRSFPLSIQSFCYQALCPSISRSLYPSLCLHTLSSCFSLFLCPAIP